jgi:GDP-L-fucose synthase
MEKTSKIYVAGHRGLVGSAILSRLQRNGYINVISRTRKALNLTDTEKVKEFLETERPEYVFLAAAKVGGILANHTYPAEFIYTNLNIQTNVLHAAWQARVRRLVFFGSSCIYPRECPQPMKEEYFLTGPLENTNQPYAVAKIAGVTQCEAYNRQYGTQYVAVMPTNLYGEKDNFDLEDSHVLPALIRKFHLAKLAARGDWEGIKNDKAVYGPIPSSFRECLIAISKDCGHSSLLTDEPFSLPDPAVTVWGSGSPRREFLHVDDLAEACLLIMNLEDVVFRSILGAPGPPLINIGCGKDISIRELALLIKNIVGFEGNAVFDTTKPDGTPRKLLDISKLYDLGWRPNISLKNGIKMTYDWYVKNAEL